MHIQRQLCMCGIRTREVGGLLSKNYLYGRDKQQVPDSFLVCSISVINNLNQSVFKLGAKNKNEVRNF